MGRSSSAKKPQAGQFDGIGSKKSTRRANTPNGGRAGRLYYPRVTKEQRGTPMEKLIYNNYSQLIQQFNAMNSHPNGLRMKTNEATSRLHGIWTRIANRMMKSTYISKHIQKNGGTAKGAKEKVKDISGSIAFGADPLRA